MRPTESASRSRSRPRCRSAAAARLGGSSWRGTAGRPRSMPRRSWGWTSAASMCASCTWSGRPRSTRSTTPRSSSTAPPRSRWRCSRGWADGGRGGGGEGPRGDAHGARRPAGGFQDFHGRRLAFESGIAANVIRPVAGLLARLYDVFVAEDATLVEVNPLLVTKDRQVVALDVKVTIDGNALYRHPDVAELRDLSAEDPQERMAKERGLTYVKLDGNVGILGNGAGLVMSTLDVAAQAGGRPANFLDAGGGSKAEAITSAVEVILSDDKVTAVLFNIFGGITRCDEVARGLIEAFRSVAAGAVRRVAGRHERQGGPGAAGGGEPSQRAHRGDDAPGCREGGEGGRAQPCRSRVARGRTRRSERGAGCPAELTVRGWRFSSTATRVSASPASPAARGPSTPCATVTTARRWSPASRPARAART
jgi:hypothetical protein